MTVRNTVVSTIEKIDSGWDLAKYQVRRRLGRYRDLAVVAYRGYGNARRFHLQGRVMRNPRLQPPEADWSAVRNLRASWKRLQTAEVPYAKIELRLGDWVEPIRATREGYFVIETPWPNAPDRNNPWQHLEMVLPAENNPNRKDIVSRAEILVPPRRARFGVISDIDDTVLQTGATSLLKMLKVTILQNARTRLAFPGAAAWYRGLYEGPGGHDANPLFYVSNSPWNLYDFLEEFFRLKGMPRGPFLLRDFGLRTAVFKHQTQWDHKIRAIRRILDFYPDMPFVLIGDTGERDPEVFREITRHDPSRIRAVIIRRAKHHPRDAEMRELGWEFAGNGIPWCLAANSLEAAQFSIEHGLAGEELLEQVRVDRAQEKTLPTV